MLEEDSTYRLLTGSQQEPPPCPAKPPAMWKHWTLMALLSLPLAAEEIRIRREPARTPAVMREGVIFADLQSLTQELGVGVQPAGEGWRIGPADPAPVPVGKVQVGKQMLDLVEGENGPLVDAEALCLALGGKATHPERSVLNLTPPLAQGPVRVNRADPSTFYFSQIRSSSNPGGSADNGNCGPCCLAMAARAYGRWPLEVADSDLRGMMTWIRKAMGHGDSDEKAGTNIPWLTRAGDKLGLHPKLFQDFDQLSGHLQKGRMVIIAGQMANLGVQGGAHAMLVVGQDGENALVNDPGLFYKRPGTTIPLRDLRKFFILGIAVGEN